MREPHWLDAYQQHVWRAYLRGTSALNERLDRDLRDGHGLSLAEYEVLVQLSEADGGQLRMAELAQFSNHSRSRLSHTVDRLEREGLVERLLCDADRRGVWASLTGAGLARLERAAMTHVAGVRECFVDAVRPADYAALGRAFEAVLDRVQR